MDTNARTEAKATAADERTDADVVVGIDLGGTKIFGGLVDRAGQLDCETYIAHRAVAARDPAAVAGTTHAGASDDAAGAAVPQPAAPPPAADEDGGPAVFEQLVQLARTLLAEARATGRRPRAVAVGAPGITRPDGLVVAAPALGWRDMPLTERLGAQVDVPVRVENDVNLAALGELHHGVGQGARSLVCIAMGTSIGGAVIIDGKLHRGRRDAAGEIGAFLPTTDFLGWRNSEWGALESIASGAGIAARAREFARSSGLALTREDVGAEDIFIAAAEGALWARAIFEETVDYLALAIANIQALLDPDRIVLGGGIARAGDRIIPAIYRRLDQALPSPPEIVQSQLGYRAGVLGAATLDVW